MDPTTNKMMTGAAGGAPPPEIISFTGIGYHIYLGSAHIDFSWDTANADTVSISPDVGVLTATSGITTHYLPSYGGGYAPAISPYTKTYTLTASTDTKSVTSSISFYCTIQCSGRLLRGKCFGGSGWQPNCQ